MINASTVKVASRGGKDFEISLSHYRVGDPSRFDDTRLIPME